MTVTVPQRKVTRGPLGRILLALLALLPILGLGTLPAAATMPGGNGRIAFVRDGDIYTVRSDATGLQRLTRSGGTSYPRWSPDGTTIAYSRTDGYIWTVRADGGDKRRLFHGAQASWSPDGRSMVYSDDWYIAAVVIRSLPDGRPKVIEEYSDSGGEPWERRPGPSARWTADGKKIVYGAVESYDMATGMEIRQAPPLASSSNYPGVSLLSWGGGTVTPEIDTAPQGTRYVFTSDANFTDGRARLYLGNRWPHTRRLLVADAGVSSPAFAPDGTSVLYTQQGADEPPVVRRYVFGSTTGPETILGNAAQPDWQPRPAP